MRDAGYEIRDTRYEIRDRRVLNSPIPHSKKQKPEHFARAFKCAMNEVRGLTSSQEQELLQLLPQLLELGVEILQSRFLQSSLLLRRICR